MNTLYMYIFGEGRDVLIIVEYFVMAEKYKFRTSQS